MKLSTVNKALRALGLVLAITHDTDRGKPRNTRLSVLRWSKYLERCADPYKPKNVDSETGDRQNSYR